MTALHTDHVDTPNGQLRIDTWSFDGYLLHDIGDEHRLTRYGARCRLQEAGLDFDTAWTALDDIYRRYSA